VHSRRLVPCLAALLFTAACVADPLPTTDELLARIGKAAAELKTYSYDRKGAVTRHGRTRPRSGSTVGMITREEGKTICRSYTAGKVILIARWQERDEWREFDAEEKRVNDGTHRWRQLRVPALDRTMVVKTRADAPDKYQRPACASPLDWTEAAAKSYVLRVTGEDVVNGERVYVLEGKFNDDYLREHSKAEAVKRLWPTIKIWISQSDLFPRRYTTFGPDGQESTEFTNVKLNGPVDETLFTYTPPEGAVVNDRTGEDTPQED